MGVFHVKVSWVPSHIYHVFIGGGRDRHKVSATSLQGVWSHLSHIMESTATETSTDGMAHLRPVETTPIGPTRLLDRCSKNK